jgi:uncharacterized damage-inducible protein DinB
MGNESVAPFYEGWRKHNGRLTDAIRALTDDQLALRAAPDKWPVWAIAAHTAGGRVYWLCGVFKESGAESPPLSEFVSGYGWEDEENRPRSSRELVAALESSWAIVERCLATWTTSMLNDEFKREIGGKTQTHTRQSVLVRMITHDAYHSGEISQILGVNGLPEIDLWRAS